MELKASIAKCRIQIARRRIDKPASLCGSSSLPIDRYQVHIDYCTRQGYAGPVERVNDWSALKKDRIEWSLQWMNGQGEKSHSLLEKACRGFLIGNIPEAARLA